jgi:thiamine phosphate synthase YjbQ (UPF0047 family)
LEADEKLNSYRKALWFNIPPWRGFVNITPQVESIWSECGIREVLCLVNDMHITDSLFFCAANKICATIMKPGWLG